MQTHSYAGNITPPTTNMSTISHRMTYTGHAPSANTCTVAPPILKTATPTTSTHTLQNAHCAYPIRATRIALLPSNAKASNASTINASLVLSNMEEIALVIPIVKNHIAALTTHAHHAPVKGNTA